MLQETSNCRNMRLMIILHATLKQIKQFIVVFTVQTEQAKWDGAGSFVHSADSGTLVEPTKNPALLCFSFQLSAFLDSLVSSTASGRRRRRRAQLSLICVKSRNRRAWKGKEGKCVERRKRGREAQRTLVGLARKGRIGKAKGGFHI